MPIDLSWCVHPFRLDHEPEIVEEVVLDAPSEKRRSDDGIMLKDELCYEGAESGEDVDESEGECAGLSLCFYWIRSLKKNLIQ